MLRSFTDRVFGGVCGGLAATLRQNAWVMRAVFVILSLLSFGAFALLYLLLWWVVPQESPTARRQRGLSVVFVLLLAALVIAAWAARDLGYLRSPAGVDLFWPGALVVLSAVFFLRQVRA